MTATTQDGLTLLPTGASGIPICNMWYMLLYAWGEVAYKNRWAAECEKSPSLDALLSFILSRLLIQRFRIGLGRDYRSNNSSLRGIRGQINFDKCIRRLSFENGMVDCSYFDYSHNVPKNQIIRSTLGELAKVGKFGPNAVKAESLAQTLRRLGNDLSGVDMPTVTVDLIRRQQLGRNDSDYRVMLNICDLLLGRNMPSEMEGIKSLPGLNREAMTLYRIYEKFVANFYKIHLEDWIISEQPVMDWFALKSSSFMPTMRPDLVLSNKSTRRMVVLDTKFTAKSLVKNSFGKDIFDSAHLYQIYAYLRTQEALSDNHLYATGILLYPSVGINLRETIRLNDHQILILTINLAQPWSGIEKDLLEFLVN